MTDIRYIAYSALLESDDGQNIPDISKTVLDKYSYLEKQDRSFLKKIIEGVIERRITIDYVLDMYSKVPTAKMKKQIRTLLRMGTYQLLYMDSVGDYAAVNETVRIAKKVHLQNLSGFVNAVLRSISKNRESIKWPDDKKDRIKYLSVFYSVPEWLVNKLLKERGEENTLYLLKLFVSVRPVTARVNLSVCEADEALTGCNGKISTVLDYAVTIEECDNIKDIPAFSDGRICVQDISSMLVCETAGIKKDDTVIDVCASPGGKTMHAADLASAGHVTACDISDAKLRKIEENIKRCGFSNITLMKKDAEKFCPEFEGAADVVIADVPCSGIGVIGRKNDIKYNIREEDITALSALQKRILKNVSRYVKDGGTFMFSTCTCTKEENDDNFRFLIDECGLSPVDFYDALPRQVKDITAKEGYLQLYGKDGISDGFFIAKLRKEKKDKK